MGFSEEAKAAGRTAYRGCREAGGTEVEARAARAAAAYRIDPDASGERSRRRNTSSTHLLMRLWTAARARAKGQGSCARKCAFEEGAKPAGLPQVCPLTGFQISLRRPRTGKSGGPRRPSIDRIDPNKGY